MSVFFIIILILKKILPEFIGGMMASLAMVNLFIFLLIEVFADREAGKAYLLSVILIFFPLLIGFLTSILFPGGAVGLVVLYLIFGLPLNLFGAFIFLRYDIMRIASKS
ncbi:MAG: hypothetical protein EA353_10945 [Puniceicoccaceae bacterium]|nr:MAG: hypothetical protein EA353_10945 [Puniceicoccaceae bacterium]